MLISPDHLHSIALDFLALVDTVIPCMMSTSPFSILCIVSLSLLCHQALSLHVRIKNELHGHTRTKVHCHTGDQSLGTQTVIKGMAIEWLASDSPRENAPYLCDVEWNDTDGYRFEAYSPTRDNTKCQSVCSWHITEEGPLLQNQKTGLWEAMPHKPLNGYKVESEKEGISLHHRNAKCLCWPPKQHN